ncbi:MAG TPA: patatin-like phospholipase family protein [Paracoccaceae bacterium]|nr:patatin-like phospholipase family protein [Paracoccaceae bacterium]HMO73493.1 patatin-like phospholipase family protein [Paracoccaceae bacterium]
MTVRLSLALQGGGAHGAFTWGVLDRLLQEDGIEIAAMSGSSAGALNGAAIKAGLLAGGRQGARDSLDALWRQVARSGDFRLGPWFAAAMPFAADWLAAWEDALPVSAAGIAGQVMSPYGFGPGWRNPLEPVVRRFDFSRICASEGPALFVAATNVRTAKVKVFEGQDITPDALLASACLPTVFQAVEIGGEAYWDGGYAGNPALFPLYDAELPDDLLIVRLNPLRREDVPRTPAEIHERITEIAFTAPLLRDLRSIAFVKRLIASGRVPEGTMKDVRVHMIADDRLMEGLRPSSKLRPGAAFLWRLKRAGRAAAEGFLRRHGPDLGRAETLDLKAIYG